MFARRTCFAFAASPKYAHTVGRTGAPAGSTIMPLMLWGKRYKRVRYKYILRYGYDGGSDRYDSKDSPE